VTNLLDASSNAAARLRQDAQALNALAAEFGVLAKMTERALRVGDTTALRSRIEEFSRWIERHSEATGHLIDSVQIMYYVETLLTNEQAVTQPDLTERRGDDNAA
jgi:hypothetical protein